MKNKLYFLITLLLCVLPSFAQELNCTVTVDYSKATSTNPQIFKNLEKAIADFVNKTVWTDKSFEQNERINCTMYVTVNTYESNNFECTLQVSASRPVFGSNFSTTSINLIDKDFNFNYTEFQPMNFNPNSYDSNLLTTLAFYSYIILGIDASTFSPNAGAPLLSKAQEVSSLATSSGIKGWVQGEKNQNKYLLITDIISPTFAPYLEALYQYHFLGLDAMSNDVKAGKDEIANAIITLSKIQDVRPNAYLTRIFFDTKTDEIVSVFSGGPAFDTTLVKKELNRISPLNSSKWDKI